jgi:hypothetical protein
VRPSTLSYPRVGSWPYTQTLNFVGKAFQGPTQVLYKHSYIRAVKSVIKLGSGLPEFSPISVSVTTPKAGNTHWRGRISTIDLLIGIACFVTQVNDSVNIKSS